MNNIDLINNQFDNQMILNNPIVLDNQIIDDYQLDYVNEYKMNNINDLDIIIHTFKYLIIVMFFVALLIKIDH